jgi:FkbM family methyltransferase
MINLLKKRRIKIDLFHFEIERSMNWAYTNNQYYEKNVEYWLLEIAKLFPTSIFLDIGANYGYYSLKMSKYFEKIISIEPVDSTFRILKSNIKKNKIKNIEAFQICLSDSNEIVKFNLYNAPGCNSLIDRKIPEKGQLKKIRDFEIKPEVLDFWISKDYNFKNSVIKLDVEGAELQVLKGSKEFIISNLPTIFFEYSDSTSLDAGYYKEELLLFLAKLNYTFFGLKTDYGNSNLVNHENIKENEISNIIAVHKSSKLIINNNQFFNTKS